MRSFITLLAGAFLAFPLLAIDPRMVDLSGIEFQVNRGPAATPDLSLTVRSGNSPDTQVETVNCDVYLKDGKDGKALATAIRNGKVFKHEGLKETKAALRAKIAATKTNQDMKSYQPGMIVPHIKYEAFSGAESRVTLQEHSERGSLFNKSKDAEELQELCFSLCHNE